ncbi:MAG: thioredoxin family protein [Sedimentisphaerales bacterium]|nr:thioredoxin family protein [Sedimentisphaerales bacterium]
MRDRAAAIRWTPIVLIAASCACAQAARAQAAPPGNAVELARHLNESSSVRAEPARLGSKPGIALSFEGTDDLHYYAKPETAPPPGLVLKAAAKSEYFTFEPAVLPKWQILTDPLGDKIEVFTGEFTIFLPMAPANAPPTDTADVEITISGIACTSLACLSPFQQKLSIPVDWTQSRSWKQITLESGMHPATEYSIWLALPMAFLAGLILNLMPCVWPVLPLIVMRIVEQAKQAKKKSATMGLTFCLGILLFFACLAGANIILKLFYGTVLQWGDQFRNPLFVGGMALLLVVLALSMFGVLTITVPASIMGKSGSSGAVATGFLAAILSTPCGFGVMAAAFGWAQAQHWLLATLAIMLIGLGMATPYLVLTSIPALLKHVPKPGKWMELLKQGIGFALLFIAVKLIAALPETRKADVLYFAVALAFCTWMWGAWTGLATRPFRRRIVRITAVLLTIGAGWIFLSPPQADLIKWQEYDSAVIEKALAEHRPVLIKFTADWCLSCQAADKLVYARKSIAALIQQKNILPVNADTTEKNYPATAALKDLYNEPGVPVSILLLPGKEEPIRMHGPWFAAELQESLRKIAGKSEDQSP